MPKEVIYADPDAFPIEIGWTAERNVQVGVVPPRSLNFVHRPTGTGGEEGQLLPVDNQELRGLWVTLSREDINKLIRALRRARDSAYGKDA